MLPEVERRPRGRVPPGRRTDRDGAERDPLLVEPERVASLLRAEQRGGDPARREPLRGARVMRRGGSARGADRLLERRERNLAVAEGPDRPPRGDRLER